MANEVDGTGREMLQQGVISIFFRNRPATGWRLTKVSSASAKRVSLYIVRAIAHHVAEALGSVPSALSDEATNVAIKWLTTAIDPSEMITDVIVSCSVLHSHHTHLMFFCIAEPQNMQLYRVDKLENFS
jgi:hypothetical protein